MVSFSSNEINSIQSLIEKNESDSNINCNSKKSKIFQKANTLISLNKKKLNSLNKDIINIMEKKDKNEKSKSKTYSNLFNKITPKSNSYFKNKNKYKTIYSNMKKIMNNNYNNYYISSNLFHNDYISDFISGRHQKIKEAEKMKEIDNKIEKLVKILNIYPNKNLNKEQYLEKTTDNEENLNIGNNENNINNKNSKLKKQKSDKFLIKGTKIISPFCDFARNHYLYKKIFYYSNMKKNLKSDSCLDNKLNIIYSENEKQYRQNLIKLNDIYRKMGRNKSYNLEPSQSETKLRSLKKRVEFMKRIVDYTYPNMVLTKIREQDKKTYEMNGNLTNIITSKIKRNNYNIFNMKMSEGLTKSLNVQKCF